MFRVPKSGLLYSFIYPFSWSNRNTKDFINEESTDKEISQTQIFLHKLRSVFLNENGTLNKEGQSIVTTGIMSTLTGLVLGGSVSMTNVRKEFIEENTTTKWPSKFEANSELQRTYFKRFFQGGFSLAMKLGLFCASFQTIEILIYSYRGLHEAINYTYAGGIVGCFYRTFTGPKGMISGAVFGSFFGSIYGLTAMGLCYLLGVKLDTVYDVHYQLLESRRDVLKKNVSDYSTNEKDQIKDYFKKVKSLSTPASSQPSKSIDSKSSEQPSEKIESR